MNSGQESDIRIVEVSMVKEQLQDREREVESGQESRAR